MRTCAIIIIIINRFVRRAMSDRGKRICAHAVTPMAVVNFKSVFFTDTHGLPPHLHYVATLPCEI